MLRALGPGLVAAALALGGCRRDDGGAPGIATTRSGATAGVRVTGARPAEHDPALRLADAICRRACRGDLEPEAAAQDPRACRRAAGVLLADLPCDPDRAERGLARCVDAIDRGRCEGAPDEVDACRPIEICGAR